ncbi:hypothetical protein VI817_009107 [Penicillium citrinum]|nr:hypothetical protein VI817_009107 [Penicillium citrinum]
MNTTLPQAAESHCHLQIALTPTPDDFPPKTPAEAVIVGEELHTQQRNSYTAFSPSRRRFILGIITVAGIFGPLAGNIYLPALPVIARQFHRTETEINITVTVFMIIFAFGVSSNIILLFVHLSMLEFLIESSSQPLIWSSFADWKGRRPLYIISILIYITANALLTALPVDYGGLLALRVVQAFGSSAVVSLGAGTVADVRES